MSETLTQYENHIPARVRRQSQRADEIARAAGVANAPTDPAATTAPAPAAEKTPEPEATTVVATPGAPATAPPVEPAAAASEPAPVEAPPAEEPDWKQRYRTLQGKYDAELGVMRDELRLLRERAQQPPLAPAAPAAPPPPQISQEDVEAYGEDLIHAARRWAAAEYQPAMQAFEQRIARLEGSTKTIAADTTRATIMQALDADASIGRTWRTTNTDPEFLAWLRQADPFAGVARGDMLRDAYSRGDVVRTAAFFKAFQAEHTAKQPPATGAPLHTAQPAGQVSLADLAAPGRMAPAGANASNATPEKRMWTRRDIQSFYAARMNGAYRGREAEANSIEQDIVSAAAEGRIR